MKYVKKSVLLGYSPEEMYGLVTDIAKYPEFLPWCEKGEILERDANGQTARLHLSYHGIRQKFTTRNIETPGQSVVLKLVDGPFSLLEGAWEFVGLGETAAACRVNFDLRYAFSSRALELLISPVFDRIVNTFVDAFVQRAQQVYGVR